MLLKKTQNLNWSQIHDYPYRMLIIRGLGSGEKIQCLA